MKRHARRTTGTLVLLTLGSAAAPPPGWAQPEPQSVADTASIVETVTSDPAGSADRAAAVGQSVAGDESWAELLEPAGLAEAELSALLEVTIFSIDVLTLTVRVDPETEARLQRLAAAEKYSDELADSVAAVILEANDLWARQVLHRDVGLGRLVGGMRETGEKAAKAGFITQEYFEEWSESLPATFGFLEEDGAKKGDEIFFRVRGDTVRTLYRTVEGRVLLNQSIESTQARRGSIPGFFAPETRFRKRLVESLLAAGTAEELEMDAEAAEDGD